MHLKFVFVATVSTSHYMGSEHHNRLVDVMAKHGLEAPTKKDVKVTTKLLTAGI